MKSFLHVLCVLELLLVHILAREDVSRNNESFVLEHPICRVPHSVTTRPSTTLLEEQLQATATSHSGKFLSFEEWKAQNLQEQERPQPSRTTKQMSHTAASSMQVAQTTGTLAADDAPISEGSDTAAQPAVPADDDNKQAASSDQESQVVLKKERFNHASFDCAASIIQSNKESKGSSNVLKENKDYYMLNTCAAEHKFVTIELCNDILVDTIQLANFEFFSGVFKDVKVLVASKYPPGREGWQELGKFRARQAREIQTFHFENPLIWTRYVRIEMLSFYGNEFYCPLSLVRVFGKTMMEDYKQEGSSEVEEPLDLSLPPAQDVASREMLSNIERAAEGLVAMSDELADSMQKNDYGLQEPATTIAVEVLSSTSLLPPTSTAIATASAVQTESEIAPVCLNSARNLPSAYPLEVLRAVTITPEASRQDVHASGAFAAQTTSTSTTLYSPIETAQMTVPQISANNMHGQNVTRREGDNATNPSDTRTAKSSPSNHPSTQESIYKQMAKRISLLEANATLSLRYIESQSSLLAQSFSHLSSTQARHLANFLENVNTTMLQRIAHLKQEYEQLYLDASRSIAASRHRQEVDMRSLTRKIGALSDDITFFKRLGIFQSVLMLVLFGFLVTSRHAGVDLQSSLHRALHPRSPLGSPTIRVGGPMTWRQHLRGQSSVGPASMYSFPIDQIERPDPSVSAPQSPSDHDVYERVNYAHQSAGYEHEEDGRAPRTGLGIHLSHGTSDASLVQSNDEIPDHGSAQESSLDAQQTKDRARLALFQKQSVGKRNEFYSYGKDEENLEDATQSSSPAESHDTSLVTGAEDYPTPRPEPNEEDESIHHQGGET